MKLYLSATSPFARIVTATLIEKGLQERVERVMVDPWASGPELLEQTPLSRIPALVTDEGTVLTESLLIATYLDRVFPERPLLPAQGLEAALHKLGLAHGVLDAAVFYFSTGRFGGGPEDPLRVRRLTAIRRTLPLLTRSVAEPAGQPDLGDLAVAVALGYLDLRLAELGWREAEPALARWYERIAARPALVETRPPM